MKKNKTQKRLRREFRRDAIREFPGLSAIDAERALRAELRLQEQRNAEAFRPRISEMVIAPEAALAKARAAIEAKRRQREQALAEFRARKAEAERAAAVQKAVRERAAAKKAAAEAAAVRRSEEDALDAAASRRAIAIAKANRVKARAAARKADKQQPKGKGLGPEKLLELLLQ